MDERRRPPIDERLVALSAHFNHRLADAGVQESRARYDFGQVLHTVRYAPASAYGRNALSRIANHLRCDESALRRTARVSETFTPVEFESAMTLRSPGGVPITWSHLELLATVRHRAERTGWLSAVIEREMSIRQLRDELRGRT